jgi:hypothetical protein
MGPFTLGRTRVLVDMGRASIPRYWLFTGALRFRLLVYISTFRASHRFTCLKFR